MSRGRYCQQHGGAHGGFSGRPRAEVDRRRGTRTARGYSNTWLRAAKAYRLAHPLCRRCEEQGRLVAAEVTDHIVPHQGDEALFWDRANWQSLCKPCHDAKTAREDGPAHAMPDWLPTPTCRVTLVCGPPAAGKSTLVRQRAAAGDTVIDLDEILSELSGQPLYAAGLDWLRRGIRERNRRLAGLAYKPSTHHAWVIVTGRKDKRAWWVEKLRPIELIVLKVDDHVCQMRILNDGRRSMVAGRQLQAMRDWWTAERAATVAPGEGG